MKKFLIPHCCMMKWKSMSSVNITVADKERFE